ncbi:MAG TPA: transcriptional repressor LexA [Candidatus Omnitrophota bacterium]|nr:transcriptional repressor LexA [Candidatus Omnitrophota bacterium]
MIPEVTLMETLTEKQQKVLNFIKARIIENMPPTIREIAQELRFSSTGTVRDYLEALEQKGYLKRGTNRSRGIELVPELLRIPIIGRIAAGRGTLAYEEIEGYVDPDDLYLGRMSMNDVFALRVKGDSMIEAGIMDGDIAIVKKQPTANNGDIIAALLDDNEVTLKRFRKGTTTYLEPANALYPPIYEEFTVAGKVLSIIRKY